MKSYKLTLTILCTALAGVLTLGVVYGQGGLASGKRYYPHDSERHDFEDIHIKSGGVITFDGDSTISGTQPKAEITAYASNGAITIKPGIAKLTKAGVDAMTLASPATTDEGTIIIITAQTANAHTVTLTAGFNNSSTAGDVATFGGAIGDNMVIVAVNGIWNVITLRNVTLG